MFEVEESLENIETARKLAEELYREKMLSEDGSELLSSYSKIYIPKEKLEAYQHFLQMREAEAKRRLPEVRHGALKLIMESLKICRLLALGVPEIVLNRHYNELAIAVAYSMYGVSYRLTELPCDGSEFDGEAKARPNGRPSQSNARKSLVPLYVYKILAEKSSVIRPIPQERILEILADYPYEIFIERKALGRVIESLVREDIGIYKSRKGVYYAEKK